MTEDPQNRPFETLPHIKRVSRIKHATLEKYLPSWAVVLGSANTRLNYFDCFAGPGRYEPGRVAVDWLTGHCREGGDIVLDEEAEPQPEHPAD